MAPKRWGGGLCDCAAGVGEFPVLVECLCAQKGFVHTSLALAEDDGGLVAGWCPSSRCVRAPCSHSLFYADRLACAGALRVPGFILIAHGSNGWVVYSNMGINTYLIPEPMGTCVEMLWFWSQNPWEINSFLAFALSRVVGKG